MILLNLHKIFFTSMLFNLLVMPAYSQSTRPKTLLVNTSFSIESISNESKIWYQRLCSNLNNPNSQNRINSLASSNNLYTYGRHLNTYTTTLLQVLRITGDPAIMGEIYKVSTLMKKQLKDWSIIDKNNKEYRKDGFLNWLYLRDNEYFGTDLHEMDEMLTHSLVAAMAYALWINRDINPEFFHDSKFWLDYLENHFEKKWRKRKNIPQAFPFLSKNLTHVHMQWIRYNYYMAKMTGKTEYLSEAKRLSKIFAQHIRFNPHVPGNPAIWDHGMPIVGTPSHGPQPLQYARYTVQAAIDLAMEGFDIFADPGFMEKISLTLSAVIMVDNSGKAFPYRIDGSDLGRESPERFAISPWTLLGRWDPSGRILKISEKVYFLTEANPEKPLNIYIPAGMVFSLEI